MPNSIFTANLGQAGQEFAHQEADVGLETRGEAQAAKTRGEAVATEINAQSYRSLGQGIAQAGQNYVEGKQKTITSDLYNQLNALSNGVTMGESKDPMTRAALNNPNMKGAFDEFNQVKLLQQQGNTSQAAVALRAEAIIKKYTNIMPGFAPELHRIAMDTLGFSAAGSELSEFMQPDPKEKAKQDAIKRANDQAYDVATKMYPNTPIDQITPEQIKTARQSQSIIQQGQVAVAQGHVDTLMSGQFNSKSIASIDITLGNVLTTPLNPKDPNSSFLGNLMKVEQNGGLDAKAEVQTVGQLNIMRQNMIVQYEANMRQGAARSGVDVPQNVIEQGEKHINERFDSVTKMVKDGSLNEIAKATTDNLSSQATLQLMQNPQWLSLITMNKTGALNAINQIKNIDGADGRHLLQQLGVSKGDYINLVVSAQKDILGGQVVKGLLPADQTAKYNTAMGVLQAKDATPAEKHTATQYALANGGVSHYLQSMNTPQGQQSLQDPQVKQDYQNVMSNQLTQTKVDYINLNQQAAKGGLSLHMAPDGKITVIDIKTNTEAPLNPIQIDNRTGVDGLKEQAENLSGKFQELLQSGTVNQNALNIKSVPQWRQDEINELNESKEAGKSTNPKAPQNNQSNQKSQNQTSNPSNNGTPGNLTTNSIKQFEEFDHHAKWDVNHYRVGYGSDTVTLANGKVLATKPGMVVSKADADRDLERRIGEYQSGIIKSVGPETWEKLPEGAQAALTSITYNYGHLPKNVAEAAKTGDPQQISDAIASHAKDGRGNHDRRMQEAKMALGSPEQQQDMRTQDAKNAALGLKPQPLTPEIKQQPAIQHALESQQEHLNHPEVKSAVVAAVDYKAGTMTIIDTNTNQVLMQTSVKQGLVPGFSNKPGSNQSSIGTFVTGERYYSGTMGTDALRIKGLDGHLNDKVFERGIVVHGTAGQHTHGCFGVPEKDAPKVLKLLAGGAIIYAEYPR